MGAIFYSTKKSYGEKKAIRLFLQLIFYGLTKNKDHEMFQRSCLGKKRYLVGSETGRPYGGYMDGAVQSAQYIFDQLNE